MSYNVEDPVSRGKVPVARGATAVQVLALETMAGTTAEERIGAAVVDDEEEGAEKEEVRPQLEQKNESHKRGEERDGAD